MKMNERSKTIYKTSIIGISLNLLLSISKAVIGFITGSIAIVMDSVNNLSDALSALVIIVGTKLASKDADKEHPYGHGRIEYLASLIVAVIIIYAGFTALIDSIKHIYKVSIPDYNVLSLILVGLAIFVKIFLGIYYRKVGKRVNSKTLVNSGTDALLDVVISSATLVAAFIYIFFDLSLEAYLALIISIIIIRSGLGMIKDTTSMILGERIDRNMALKIKRVVNSFDEVKGVYDLTINNYGPESFIGSFHIEVDEELSAIDIDLLTRKITQKVYRKTGVVISAIGIYSMNTKDKKALKMKKEIDEILLEYPDVLSMHGFYVNIEEKTINFDIIISFDSSDRLKTFYEVKKEIQNTYKDYKVYIVLDADLSD